MCPKRPAALLATLLVAWILGAPAPACAEADPLAWASRARDLLSSQLELQLEQLPPEVREPLERTLASPEGRLAVGGGVLGLLVLVAIWRRSGRADLVVAIEYPAELRGTFSVRLATARGRYKRASRRELTAVLRRGASTATEHHLVGRETQFQGLLPRVWYVTVDGILQDRAGEGIVADHFEERAVRVRRRQRLRLEFDFRPDECPVSVKVLWDGQPVREAGVALRGRPYSARFSKGAPAQLQLAPGSHVLVAGADDRVAEREIEVEGGQPVSIDIDLGLAEHLLFKGCPPAVTPYLQADLNGAARALDRDGQRDVAELLLGRLHREAGQLERAARHFEGAGRPLEAAQMWAGLTEYRRAAELYEQGGDAARAAEMFRSAGDDSRAGAAFEAVGDLDAAIACYRESGEVTRWTAALALRGKPFEAAHVALEHEQRPRALDLFQQVPREDPNYGSACVELAKLLAAEGHFDLAAEKLGERIQAGCADEDLPELLSQQAQLWERADALDRALDAVEALRRRAPTWPNVASRIETIRKKISAQRVAETAGSTGRQTQPAPALVREGRYEVLERIGAGGMSVVYKARDRRLGRVVALKRMPDSLRDHPEAVKLFLREAQAVASLNHRNIVTVHDVDEEDGTFFITMELLEGQPLHEIVRRHRQLGARDVARLGQQAAAGLQYAHENRIVHRDVKTANLFVTNERVVKIMDFGLAKTMERVRQVASVIGGTPFYMAPEQSAGESVDHRADVYGLGATLYELVTGAPPFTEGDVAYQHRHTPPPDPRTRAEGVPDALAELILHMLAKRPDERCASAAEVAARLDPLARS
ncbi:MAG: protein kinase [Myxococcota bacterium]|nr:protein kinase [Myxococcota bacterium]